MNKGSKGNFKKTPGGRGIQRQQLKKGKTEMKKGIEDYHYYLGSATQFSDFEVTTEFVVNHIKKTFEYGNDIGSALKELRPINTEKWRVSMKFSDSQVALVRDQENRQYEMEYKSDYEEYKRRVNVYDNNLIKAYAILWERCTKGMKQKIEARVEFSSTIENDPIELLKAIKVHTQHYQEHRYNMSIVLDSIRGLINTKQKEGELLQDWTKRFRIARDLLESHLGGPLVIKKIVESLPEYDVSDPVSIRKCQEKTFEKFLAYLYLENADRTKYGSLLNGLNTQQSLGNNQYPKSVTEANNVLSNHRLDNPSKMKREQDEKFKQKTKKEESKEQEINLSFAQLEGKCYCCGKPGHRSPTCRYKNKPREEWAITKSQQSHVQSNEAVSTITASQLSSTDQSPNTEVPSATSGWAGAHVLYGFVQSDMMQNCILLDNQSSVTVFSNKELVENIHATDDTPKLYTNGGTLTTNLKCNIPEWGEAWFAPNGITNIFSYAEMAKRYRITSDSSVEKAFTVHLPQKKVKFEEIENGLYVFIPKKFKIPEKMPEKFKNVQFLSSVKENKKFVTPNQF
jgi:hypothetical protein